MEGCVGFAEAKEAVWQEGSGGDFFKVFEGVVGVALAGMGWVKGAVDGGAKMGLGGICGQVEEQVDDFDGMVGVRADAVVRKVMVEL